MKSVTANSWENNGREALETRRRDLGRCCFTYSASVCCLSMVGRDFGAFSQVNRVTHKFDVSISGPPIVIRENDDTSHPRPPSLLLYSLSIAIMDTLALPMSSPKSLKRTYSDTGLKTKFMNNVNDTIPMASQTTAEATFSVEQPSRSVEDSASKPNAPNPISHSPSTPAAAQSSSATASAAPGPTKKRAKLSASEKEAKEKERVELQARKEEERLKKEREKEETRIRKEQEKAKLEEDKQARLAEKEKRRLEKEEQNKLREGEKRKKEEEKIKKNKSQLRLNAFFPRPSLTHDGSTPSPTRGSLSPANSRRSSITSINDIDGHNRDRSVSVTPSKPKSSDYDRLFPSFFLQSHTVLAPCNRFERDEEGLQFVQKTLDSKLAANPTTTNTAAPFNPKEMLHVSPYKRRKVDKSHPSVKDIVDQLHGTSHKPIDLTKSQSSQHPLELLKSISTRVLKFAEDVRPPYIGTYTRVQDSSAARKICRNPFGRDLPDTDYEYDSEAEWEDPGEGEDLDSEGEEEVESEDGDDMEGFLDDEDTGDGIRTLQKRRLLTGDLQSISTGLCWEDASHNLAVPDLEQYRLEIILATLPPSSSRPSQSVMDPPRIPLNAINRTNLLIPNPAVPRDGFKPQLPGTNLVLPSKTPKRMVALDVLEDFKRAVEGSDLTKAGLVEVLKKQFPKQSKDAIKDTLGAVAERIGKSEKDKRWVIKT
ncbi:MAG: hypothetical protein Q9170_007296 [Blastenia crenularia]